MTDHFVLFLLLFGLALWVLGTWALIALTRDESPQCVGECNQGRAPCRCVHQEWE